MPPGRVDPSHFSPDIQQFIQLLYRHRVRYLITGGEAVIYYGHARLTGDVDFFYENREDNARKLYLALDEFWQGDIPGIERVEELMQQGLILQFGRPPNRIDLINHIDGVKFEEAWNTRTDASLTIQAETVRVYYLGLEKLIKNKASSGRPKDLDDLAYLKQAARERRG